MLISLHLFFTGNIAFSLCNISVVSLIMQHTCHYIDQLSYFRLQIEKNEFSYFFFIVFVELGPHLFQLIWFADAAGLIIRPAASANHIMK